MPTQSTGLPRSERAAQASGLMEAFVERTSIRYPAPNWRRYLWTDAYAVCALLSLHRSSGDAEWLRTARMLIRRVHETLGRHRHDDHRRGWISGLSEADGALHPTKGGLRIGKPLPERGHGEAADPRVEWDRDGQYFHYLSRWMHALCRFAAVTGEREPLVQAIELAEVAHMAFCYDAGDGARRMVWKMSIDLRWPQVAAMGLHDPLDGWLTGCELLYAAHRQATPPALGALHRSIVDYAAMAADVDPASDDPLSLGALLAGAGAMAQWIARGDSSDYANLIRLLSAACRSLDRVVQSGSLGAPAQHRLPFRELGLALGLSALPAVERAASRRDAPGADAQRLERLLQQIRPHLPLGEGIVTSWLDPDHRATTTYREHEDINDVMLASALLPQVALEA